MLGPVVTFMAGGWLAMSAFAWPQSEAACVNTCLSGVLAIAYGLLSIFFPRARLLNSIHAWIVCVVSMSVDASAAARANNVMFAAVIFGASLASWPDVRGARAVARGAGPPLKAPSR
jgi:hypothetical protein